MPPKKKGVVIDGVDTTRMTREEVEEFALKLKEQNEREREERNFFQVERDKLRTFWEITRNELNEARAKLRNKDRKIEEGHEQNDEEITYYKRNVKLLEFEHKLNIKECKKQTAESLQRNMDDHIELQQNILGDKRNLKKATREKEMTHQEKKKALELGQSEDLVKAKEEFEDKARETENKYEQRYLLLNKDLDIKHNMEIVEVEERTNTHIGKLTDTHQKYFDQMQNYYNDITLNNIALISSLKDQMESLRKQNEKLAKQAAELTSENRKLVEPLQKVEARVVEFKRQMQNYEKDKTSLANVKLKLRNTQKELSEMQSSYKDLELRFENLQAERDDIQQQFVKSVVDTQQKTGKTNELLQNKIQTLSDAAECRKAVISQLSTKALPQHISKKLEDILTDKNATIKDLQYELAKVCKAHDDMIETYEVKLLNYGIPKQELGYTQMRVLPKGQAGFARGPAGLITKNK